MLHGTKASTRLNKTGIEIEVDEENRRKNNESIKEWRWDGTYVVLSESLWTLEIRNTMQQRRWVQL